MAKQVSPGVLALRKVVDDVYADAREAKKQGKLVGWSSSKFPCELAEAFDLNVMYPENQAAGIAAAWGLKKGIAANNVDWKAIPAKERSYVSSRK